MEAFTQIKRVAIIGAGSAGLATAKYLLAEKVFSKIVLFEQRQEVGGVWNYSGSPSRPWQFDFTIPRVRPSQTVEKPVVQEDANNGTKKAIFPSPLYDYLETNIPYSLMNFTDHRFPADSALFPKFEVVKRYLDGYAEDVKHLVRLGTQVLQVSPESEAGRPIWKVISEDVISQKRTEEQFDAVVCANGHYSDPFIPDIEGLKEFQQKYPDVISHSKYYRKPEVYADKKVLIIGNSASGLDISTQISKVTPHVIVSEKEKPNVVHNPSTSIHYRPEITSFLPDRQSVRFADGHVESDIDSVIFCTGYQYSFPFLQNLVLPVVTTGQRTNHVWEQVVYWPRPTLTFLTLPQRIVPFPVAEAQAAYISRVYSGRVSLPSTEEMKAWEEARVQEKGDGKGFHDMMFPADAEYINRLHNLSMSAAKIDERRLENDGAGKIPPYWGEEKQWVRQRIQKIKQVALSLGDKRLGIKSLQDLGFDYAAWKTEEKSLGLEKTQSKEAVCTA
ncbi:FAD/NAD(P)-binding domain-containing protein [Aaosphaeria arxii CBS 175.79]|uniref:FAD/NAD(P)-binding domain-containing protein n=1 Tax=Aaosphaeria arxii CBS 175.79 TaxID=1450172 RepID=A0A6A5X6G5_9PLEO|nr:FAD/NAD(P)-binding domain-containing protein [Aaosphaeria arxii CBS 175.79]KAF2008512.1 FAD/NAD(P)-binding domain-containing protein [Aaosphaeria arxii CBS 175.79]